jgi:hypothetical protein
MLTEVSTLDKQHADDIKQRWAEVFAVCQQMVEQGIDEGLIEDLDPAGYCFWYFFNFAMVPGMAQSLPCGKP